MSDGGKLGVNSYAIFKKVVSVFSSNYGNAITVVDTEKEIMELTA